MKISYNWLREYLSVELSPDRVAEMMTGCGLEVEATESFETVRGGLRGVVTGRVLTCIAHPNSDHLSITTVDTGKEEPLRIVCGASNVAAGQKVAVATIGTRLFFGDKEIVIQKTKIRGEVSEGMICAEDELGIGSSHEGILVLPEDTKVGLPAASLFGIEEDKVFSIGLTPNRVDAASHIGVARDLTAVYNNHGADTSGNIRHEKLIFPHTEEINAADHGLAIGIRIEDPLGCRRYSGLTISGIRVAPSPAWLCNRLIAVGLRPINNIVDITNYVLMETGQPLHAFDADKIAGKTVVVRKFPENTPFITLDGIERKLSGQDLMICDTEKPMCIAGVFGGIDSGVTENTVNLFLESACFDPVHIRKTSRYHGLQTDASFRFERGSDVDITITALKRAASLVLRLAGGTAASEIIDVYPNPAPHSRVTFSFHHLDRLAGKKLDRKVVRNILADLGIMVLEERDANESLLPDGTILPGDIILELDIPAAKVDVTREADVMEEILRIYGYNNIEFPSRLRISPSHNPNPDPEKLLDVVSELLVSNGFYEMMNNSLTRSSYYTGLSGYPDHESVKILNPISRDLDIMRRNLLFGGLESVARNLNRKSNDLKLFEFGRVYSRSDNRELPLPGYREENRLLMIVTGADQHENWNNPEEPVTFFNLKAVLHMIMMRVGFPYEKLVVQTGQNPLLTQCLEYLYNGVPMATVGIVTSELQEKFDIRQPVFASALDWDQLLTLTGERPVTFKGLSRFPEVRRDLALVVDDSVTYSELEALAFRTEKKFLRKVGLFDVYEGEKIGAGKKSYAMSFILQDEDKTLTDNDIEKAMEKLMGAFKEKFNARLR